MTREIPLTKGYVALVSDEDFEALTKHRWHVTKSAGPIPYACRYVAGIGRVRMHHVVCPPTPGMLVDHINRNPLDNRRENLRVCTHSQNRANTTTCPNRRRTLYRGVKKQNRRWAAQLRCNGVLYNSPFFGTELEAAKAYDDLARYHFGEFAVLNFPEGAS